MSLAGVWAKACEERIAGSPRLAAPPACRKCRRVDAMPYILFAWSIPL